GPGAVPGHDRTLPRHRGLATGASGRAARGILTRRAGRWRPRRGGSRRAGGGPRRAAPVGSVAGEQRLKRRAPATLDGWRRTPMSGPGTPTPTRSRRSRAGTVGQPRVVGDVAGVVEPQLRGEPAGGETHPMPAERGVDLLAHPYLQ